MLSLRYCALPNFGVLLSIIHQKGVKRWLRVSSSLRPAVVVKVPLVVEATDAASEGALGDERVDAPLVVGDGEGEVLLARQVCTVMHST